jgi:hypothetical protein
MPLERGIIVGSDQVVDVTTNSITSASSDPNPGLPRQAVLYWDRIDFPQNNLMYVGCQDIDSGGGLGWIFTRRAGQRWVRLARTWRSRRGCAGAVLSPISFTAKLGNVLADLPPETRNYAYLYHVEREFPGTLGGGA